MVKYLAFAGKIKFFILISCCWHNTDPVSTSPEGSARLSLILPLLEQGAHKSCRTGGFTRLMKRRCRGAAPVSGRDAAPSKA